MHCKAYCDQQACPLAADMYGYCSEHFKQERGLYHYYKAHEQMYHQYHHDECVNALERKHQHITLAIQARQLHTDWFFHDSKCDSHDDHVLGLMYDQGFLQRGIFDSGLGYISADINETTRARLEEAVLKIGSDWQEENVCGRYGDMPSIQIVSSDTPGARYVPKRPELVNWEDFEVPEDNPWTDVSGNTDNTWRNWCDEPAAASATARKDVVHTTMHQWLVRTP
ncbi:hypothetical protein DL769_000799 [Monosporascus sp. CRB-8-3]|nr:hypothetical protein DL769_000799 [Monosporascus sp. CRB-8-3]